MAKNVPAVNGRVVVGANSVVEVKLTSYVTKEELMDNHTRLRELHDRLSSEVIFRQLLDATLVRHVKSDAIIQGLESLSALNNTKVAIFGANFVLTNIVNLVLAPSRKLNKFRSVSMFKTRDEALAWLLQN